MIFPPALRPGDDVVVIAPSSPFDRTLALRGLGWLSERYRVRWDRALFAREGYLAGSDERRLAELQAALGSGARAIVAARGGYGLPRIAHLVDWSCAPGSPGWIVGFSDVTALHIEAAARGVASIHGPMVCTLGRADARARARWIRALEAPLERVTYERLACWSKGRAVGPLFGGNLCILHGAAASGRLVVPRGAVLVLEDVGERPYRVDRMLTGLDVGGHLARVSAVVVGDFTDCGPGPDGVSVEAVLRERLSRLGVPVLAGAPIGHDKRNDPVTFGAPARVDADAGTLEIGG